MLTIRKLLNSFLGEEKDDGASIAVLDEQVIENFIKDIDSPFLVSFPGTGSHWLRMIMELYFKRPSLVRVFYYPEITNYLTLHTHDIDLSVERENVIYLYRDPVETVYSQMNYYKEDIHNQLRIIYWADLYGRHLAKWLYLENFTKNKTVVTYEGMKRDMVKEFGKIAGHFNEELDRNRLMKAMSSITREEVKKKTSHDPQVVQLNADYRELRQDFKQLYGQQVWDSVLKGRAYLAQFFEHQ